jgi:hypothetical protein
MPEEFATEATALGVEVRHWRRACTALGDLEVAAAPGAWKELESYLGRSVRASLNAQAKRLNRDGGSNSLRAQSRPDC